MLKTFDYDCIKEYRCILGVSNIQFKSKLNFGALAEEMEGWLRAGDTSNVSNQTAVGLSLNALLAYIHI